MNLKCKINGKEYNVAQGATFAEEYNETLDSGTIIIPHVKKIRDLMPFDDVFIYNSKSEFKGYGPGVEMPKFYKHLLVDQFSEEIINLDEGIYTYKIELMSETKKLEVIQLPNISITQPLKKENKKSVYEYLIDFVDLYSPLKKVSVDGEKWTFKKKYSVDPELEKDFGNVYAPDFSLNAPSLKDVIAQLMLVKDRIPFVKDDVICALDISVRKGPFDLNTKYVNYISGSRSSANHADNLKRTYSNALSQDNTCDMVEYMGFRNSDSALLTLQNLRLETRYPIYKINKVYMCYYKKINFKIKGTETMETKYFLCKQDISKLVKLNSERNLLSQDWNDFHSGGIKYKTVDELSKYKMMTVGYNIGSNYIEGWGTQYSYPSNWWSEGSTNGFLLFDNTASYVQNIFGIMNNFYPLGIYSNGFIDEFFGEESENYEIQLGDYKNARAAIKNEVVNPYEVTTGWEDFPKNWDDLTEMEAIKLKPISTFLKSLFFIVDYNAFYNGTIVYSKDDRYRDDITINDNASASLTILEKDGIFQKEKANRFGNKGIAINARYSDVSQIQELGSVYENDDDTDVVIYHKEYSIYDNVINCSYAGTKNYVLKNYFTSVFARYRTYNLMSYGESTTRAENNKMMVLFSKDKSYCETENKKIEFNKNTFLKQPLEQIFSFNTPTEATKVTNFFENRGQINAGVIGHKGKWYLSDVNKFVAGQSLCFNTRMFDNASGGVYIKQLQPLYNLKVKDDFVGSVQDWYLMVDDVETGKAEFLSFYIFNLDDENQYANEIIPRNSSDERDLDYIKTVLKDRIMKLPYIDNTPASFSQYVKNMIGGQYKVNKDNKETIDMTFQFEPICYEKDVVISPWMMKLSDLLGKYNKFDDGFTDIDTDGKIINLSTIQTTINEKYAETPPMMVIEVEKKYLESLIRLGEFEYNKEFFFDTIQDDTVKYDYIHALRYTFKINKLTIYDSYVEIKGVETIYVGSQTSEFEKEEYVAEKIFKFKKIESSEYLKIPDDKVYFSNIEITGISNKGFGNFITYQWTYPENNIKSIIEDDGTEKPIIISFEARATFMPGSPTFRYDIEDIENNPTFTTLNSVKDDSVFPLKNGKLIYTKNMYLVYSTETIKKDVIYEEYKLDDLSVSDEKVSDRFAIEKDDLGRDYLKVDLLNIPESISSVQYWYLNNGSLHFVFGVNITEKDIQNGYVKIYLSLLSTRDTRVYDENNNLVGEIYNYADLNNDKKYGEGQYYCDIIENDK